VSLDGVQGPHDGWLLVIFALIALAGVQSLSRHGWLGIVTVLGAACAMLYTAVGNLLDDRVVFGGNAGWAVRAAFGRLHSPGAGDVGAPTIEGSS
jgi:hypothetical protein